MKRSNKRNIKIYDIYRKLFIITIIIVAVIILYYCLKYSTQKEICLALFN